MATRVNGGVFSNQALSGELTHYSVTGADFTGAYSDGTAVIRNGAGPNIDFVIPAGKPVPGSAAEIVLLNLEDRATVVIMNPAEEGDGLFFALENTTNGWTPQLMQDMIRSLGSSVGVDNVDLRNAEVSIQPYSLGAGGASSFLDLIDTPDTYAGSIGYVVAVNNAGDGLEFVSGGGGGGGESNIAGNLGTGEGIYAQKSGIMLQFKSLIGGDGIDLVSTGTDITIAVSGLTSTDILNDSSASGSTVTETLDSFDASITSNTDAIGNIVSDINTLSIDDLVDVDISSLAPTEGQTLVWSATKFIPGTIESGTSTFLQLTDTPASYDGANGYVVAVNSAGDGLEFVPGGGGGGVGEANTGTNLGTGQGIFSQKSDVTLQFKSLTVSGLGLSISSTSAEVKISMAALSTDDIGNVSDIPGATITSVLNNIDTDISSLESLTADHDSQLNTLVLDDLQDVNLSTPPTLGQILSWNNTYFVPVDMPEPVFNFIELTDTPSTYSGYANYSVAVNSGGTGLEFVPGGTGETNTGTNLGIGEQVFAQKNVLALEFRSLIAGSGISLSTTSTDITFDVDPIDTDAVDNSSNAPGITLSDALEDLDSRIVDTADGIGVDAGSFTKNLVGSGSNVQNVLNTIDQMDVGFDYQIITESINLPSINTRYMVIANGVVLVLPSYGGIPVGNGVRFAKKANITYTVSASAGEKILIEDGSIVDSITDNKGTESLYIFDGTQWSLLL